MATKCLTTTWKHKASNFAKVNNINENNAIEQLIGIINRLESENMSDDEIMTTLSDIFNAKVDRTEFTENQNKIFDTLVNREYVNLNVVQKSLNTLQKCTTNIQPFVFKTQKGTYKIGAVDRINNKKPYKRQQEVEALFNENPELANSVYEALGLDKDSNYYENNIKPEPNTIFVFGSNPEGRHGAGAAKVAREQFGAVYGQGEGLQGNAYALPTKDLKVKENRGFKSISPEQITNSIKKLYETAKQNPNKQFKVAYRNTTDTSLNGYTGLEMIEMFNQAGTIPSNVIFSKEWVDTNKLNIKRQITPQQKQQALQLYQSFLDIYLQDFLTTDGYYALEEVLVINKIIDRKCN